MKQRFVTTLVPVLFLPMALGLSVPAQEHREEITMVRGKPMHTVLNPGDIPAIFDPVFLPVSNAESLYYADEPVLAVIDGDSAKAYSIWRLDHHEVANDYINGKAITVTW